MELKSQLKELQEKELFCLNKQELEELIEKMLENIGDTDPELRDHLIYSTFMRLIASGLLSENQCQYVCNTCLDEQHLFYKLGETNTDSVFTRSFSSLVLTGLLVNDQQERLFSREYFDIVFKKSIEYLSLELDTRGFVEEKGWAHSIAHGADLLVSIVKHPFFNMECYHEILEVLRNCIFKDATYIDDEDERLIFVIEALIERNMDEKVLEEWIIPLYDGLELIYQEEGFSNNYFRRKFNVTNFLKTLYFRNSFKRVQEIIKENLNKLHQKVYS